MRKIEAFVFNGYIRHFLFCSFNLFISPEMVWKTEEKTKFETPKSNCQHSSTKVELISCSHVTFQSRSLDKHSQNTPRTELFNPALPINTAHPLSLLSQRMQSWFTVL